MTQPAIRHVGTIRETSTFKVADDKVEHGEAVVIVVGERAPTINCLTCGGYKCLHARAIAELIGWPVASNKDGL